MSSATAPSVDAIAWQMTDSALLGEVEFDGNVSMIDAENFAKKLLQLQ
jgi:hypothetical protein